MAEHLDRFKRMDAMIVEWRGAYRTDVSESYATFASSVEEKLKSIATFESVKGCITATQERACLRMLQGMEKWCEG